jgi:hypothetical protein
MTLSVLSAGDYYRVNCPFCRDTRQRLWINHMYAMQGPDGQRMTHLAHCYNESCLERPGRRRELAERLLGFQNVNNRGSLGMYVEQGIRDDTPAGPSRLPGECVRLLDLAPSHPARHYMQHKRRYTEQDIFHYDLRYCIRPDVNPAWRMAYNRIIFPVYFNNVLVGWQARYPDDVDWKALGLVKYFTQPGMHKGRLLYNLDRARTKPFVVISEGVTDVRPLGDYGVALLGKSLSVGQRSLLYQVWPTGPILFLLDPDASGDMDGIICEMLASRPGMRVLQIRLPGEHDPGDYDPTTLWNIIHHLARGQGVTLPGH